MMEKVFAFLNSLDFLNIFGYVPQFTIKKQACYKSEFAAIMHLFYFVLFWYYVITVTLHYIKAYNEVDAIKVFSSESTNYNFSTQDIYFGIGIMKSTMVNLSLYPGINIALQYVFVDEIGRKNYTNINLTTCEMTNFYSPSDWKNIPNDEQEFLIKRLTNYLCPDSTSFSQTLIPYKLLNYSYYQFIVKAANESVLNSTIQQLSLDKPKIQLIWSGIDVVSQEKDAPYKTYLDFLQSSFHENSYEEVELFLTPFTIYDDDYRFSSQYRIYKDYFFSTQPQGEIFNVEKVIYRTLDQFGRKIPPNSSDTDHLLFQKFKINLSSQSSKIYRNYTKFVDFLAQTTALTSNILFFLMIFISWVNSVLAQNILLGTLFSSNSIKHMKEFENDYKNILINDKNYLRPSSNGDKQNNIALEKIKIIKKPLENEVKKDNIEVRKNQTNISHENELRIDKKDSGSIDDKSSIVSIKLNKEPNDQKFVLQDQEVDIEFSFMYAIRGCFCIKDKSSKTYDYAAESLDYSMDIETLISKYNEIEMIKQYLFDEHQTKIFETLSRLSTVQRFFSQIKQENENIFEDDDEKIKLILNEVTYLLNRGLKTDKKLLSFFRALFNLK